MAALPSYVKVLSNSYEEQRGKGGVVRSNMESGPSKQRRTQSRCLVTRQLSLYIKGVINYRSWVEWVKIDIQSGTDWFTWVDPVDDVSKLARIVNGEYTGKSMGSLENWTVSLTLETWE